MLALTVASGQVERTSTSAIHRPFLRLSDCKCVSGMAARQMRVMMASRSFLSSTNHAIVMDLLGDSPLSQPLQEPSGPAWLPAQHAAGPAPSCA